MRSTTVLTIALGATALAPVFGVLALVLRDPNRANVNRTLATIGRGYVDPNRRPSFGVRVGGPLARRLGRLGTALTVGGAVARLQRLLDRAGNPPSWPVERVVAAKGIGLVAGLCGGVLFGLMLGGTGSVLLATVIGAVVGFFGPDLAIYNAGAKRQEELRRSLPDVLDTLTICVEAGQGFDAALAQVARNGKGPMAGEAARVLQEMRIGKSRSEALRAMSARTTVGELRGFAASVVHASDLGVPVAQVLREQSREMRMRRRQRAEELAQKVPVKILFPTLFCLFPALFVVVLGPGVINIIHTFAGH
ncbi:type II secretion system F family protein [Planosporangium thailandense]|uniref:Type II secretion system F family protein n=1 Tax=Planosporangium thailandense TaxID=765197 RepID=A0ABX0Y648_9ACTN|nr:type II secretion system F family protein [Planosporangium thailandense]NJC73586.1 type II secretion system F family protein [Planosporangium thailandense]